VRSMDDPFGQGLLFQEPAEPGQCHVVSASYKTDIPAFYGDWFLRRFEAGVARTVNPYNGKASAIAIKGPTVLGHVYWTRNLGPFAKALSTVEEASIPWMVQYTITGYGKALEAATLDTALAVQQLKDLAAKYGPKRAVWRYDPIVFSSLSSASWHFESFGKLAQALKGSVDEVVVSFYQHYRKSERNMAAAAQEHGFLLKEPNPEQKQGFLKKLAAMAADNGMRLSICAQRELLSAASSAEASGEGEGINIYDAACIDLKRLSAIANREITLKGLGHRGKDCACAPSKDIGAYDTCGQGCAYCYANISRDGALRNMKLHDPLSDFLHDPA